MEAHFNYEKLGDILKEARKANRYSQKDVAGWVGKSGQSISDWEKGSTKIDIETLAFLCKKFDLDFTDVLSRSAETDSSAPVTPEEMVRVKKFRVLDVHGQELVDVVLDKEYSRMTAADKTYVEHRNNITYINCYDLAVSAGIGEPLDSDYKTRIEIPTEKVPDDANFCLRVNGDSMEPAYSDGDVVFVQRIDGFVREGEIGIFVLNGEGFIKRWGGDQLISLNPKYDPIKICEYDDLRCQGRVLGKI